MANIQYIDFYSSIGDSLSTIQDNFVQIDQNIQFVENLLSVYVDKLANFSNAPITNNFKFIPTDAPNILLDSPDITNINLNNNTALPLSLVENMLSKHNFIKDNFNTLIKIADDITTNKSAWEQATTLVSANSARWINPITLLYPCILEEPSFRATNQIRDEVSQWLNKHFPVVTSNGNINYVESQYAYVGIMYKLYNVHPNHTDETVHKNIQTLVFAVKNCIWQIVDYLIGDQIAPWPTSAPTLTPTPTPTNTPEITNTPTVTPTVTPSFTQTPTNTPVTYFTLKLDGMNADTGSGNGQLAITCSCFFPDSNFTIRIGRVSDFLDNNIPWVIEGLVAGVHSVEVICYNSVRAVSKIVAVLVIPLGAGSPTLKHKGATVFIGDTIWSSF